MIPLGDSADDLNRLSREYKRLTDTLIRPLADGAETLSLPPTRDARAAGLDGHRLYVVRGGMLAACRNGRRLFLCDEGDALPPDPHNDLTYQADGAVLLASYDHNAVLHNAATDASRARCWIALLLLRQAMLTRLLAAQVPEDSHANSTFAYFNPGDVLIRQGDVADGVFNLFEGEADVLVDDVVVGQVREGEILGAIAVLTHAPRGATVRARGRCSAVKVPRDRFHHLIRSNPTLIQGLMTDMARQITALNGQVVTLSERVAPTT